MTDAGIPLHSQAPLIINIATKITGQIKDSVLGRAEANSNFQYAGAVNLFVAPFSDGTPPLRNRKFARLFAGGRWIRTIGSASWRAHEVRPDSLPERAGFELSVPGDGELCWGALTLGCIRGDRSAGAGTVQCDFFCSAGFENAQATRFFPAQYERVWRAIRAARRNGAEQRESR